MTATVDSVSGLEYVPAAALPRVLIESFGHSSVGQSTMPLTSDGVDLGVPTRYFFVGMAGTVQCDQGSGLFSSKSSQLRLYGDEVVPSASVRPTVIAIDYQHIIFTDAGFLKDAEHDSMAAQESKGAEQSFKRDQMPSRRFEPQGSKIPIADIREMCYTPEYTLPASVYSSPAEVASHKATLKAMSQLKAQHLAAITGKAATNEKVETETEIDQTAQLVVSVVTVVLRVSPGTGGDPYDVVFDLVSSPRYAVPFSTLKAGDPEKKSAQQQYLPLSIAAPLTLQKMLGAAWTGSVNITGPFQMENGGGGTAGTGSGLDIQHSPAQPFGCSAVLAALIRVLVVLARTRHHFDSAAERLISSTGGAHGGQAMSTDTLVGSLRAAAADGSLRGVRNSLRGAASPAAAVSFKTDDAPLRITLIAPPSDGTASLFLMTSGGETGHRMKSPFCARFTPQYLPPVFAALRFSPNSFMATLHHFMNPANSMNSAAGAMLGALRGGSSNRGADLGTDCGMKRQVETVVSDVLAEIVGEKTGLQRRRYAFTARALNSICERWNGVLSQIWIGNQSVDELSKLDVESTEEGSALVQQLLAAGQALKEALRGVDSERAAGQTAVQSVQNEAGEVQRSRESMEGRETEMMQEYIQEMREIDAEKLQIKESISALREELDEAVNEATMSEPQARPGSPKRKAKQSLKKNQSGASPHSPTSPYSKNRGFDGSSSGKQGGRRGPGSPTKQPTAASPSAVVQECKAKQIQEDVTRLEKMATEYEQALTALQRRREANAALMESIHAKAGRLGEEAAALKSAERARKQLTDEKLSLEHEVLDLMEALRKTRDACRKTTAAQCSSVLASRNRLSTKVDGVLLECGRERALHDKLRAEISKLDSHHQFLSRQLAYSRAERTAVKDLAREALIAGSINVSLGHLLTETKQSYQEEERGLLNALQSWRNPSASTVPSHSARGTSTP